MEDRHLADFPREDRPSTITVEITFGPAGTAARGIFDLAPVMLATRSAADSSPLSQNAFLQPRLSRKKQVVV
jgi:hypothetical protein